MPKGKSKDFIIRGDFDGDPEFFYVNGKGLEVVCRNPLMVCRKPFARWFGIKVKPDEKKRIRITIEEVKG